MDFDGCRSLLRIEFILLKASPQLVELISVGLDVVGMVNDGEVLLVMAASLVGPVEGASHDKALIDDHELVVHVVGRRIVSANGDTILSELDDVGALSLGALIIGDDTHINAVVVAFEDSLEQVVVGESEDTNDERLLGLLDILNNAVDVLLVREEDSVEVLWLGAKHVLADETDKLAEVREHLLGIIVRHLCGGHVEHESQGLVANSVGVTCGHLVELAGNVAEVEVVHSEVLVARDECLNLFVGSSDARNFVLSLVDHYVC